MNTIDWAAELAAAKHSTVRASALARELRSAIKAASGGAGSVTVKSAKLSELSGYVDQLTAIRAEHNKAARTRGLLNDGMASADGAAHGVTVGKFGAPQLALDPEQISGMFEALQTRSQYRATVKDVASVSGQLPPTLRPGIVPRSLEPTRVAAHLPTEALGAPTTRILQHTSTTGAAGTVAPGATKPAAGINVTPLDITARKVAVTTSVVDEDLADVDSFASYLQNALTALLIDAENAQLLTGDGTGTNLLGLFNTTGALTTAVDGSATPAEIGIDAIERGITLLRTGASFAEADLIVANPTTFSALRRSKDGTGRYYLNPDPTADEASKLWGIDVVLTTQCPAGKVLIADTSATSLFVREGISVRMGPYGAGDFTSNKTTFIVEERLALGVTKPSSLCIVTGL
ncbi:phage major capsid protein [Gordonia sp. DT30]|uniref:phage major capsid protein n=1 Tax=Gordonia sp. DT30 TaxID=3416546 RepID=UPI003CEF2D2C